MGAPSETDGRGCDVNRSAFSGQLIKENVSVAKLGVGDGGRVTVSIRGTEAKAPSTCSSSMPGSNRRMWILSNEGRSEVVTKGEPSVELRSRSNHGDDSGTLCSSSTIDIEAILSKMCGVLCNDVGGNE